MVESTDLSWRVVRKQDEGMGRVGERMMQGCLRMRRWCGVKDYCGGRLTLSMRSVYEGGRYIR